MPGLLGVFAEQAATKTEAAIRSILHRDSFVEENIPLNSNACLGRVLRGDVSSDGLDYREDSIRLSFYGHAISYDRTTKQATALTAQQLLAGYRAEGCGYFASLEGAFIVCIVDLEAATVEVVNDRLGVLPVYYVVAEEFFGFAPEPKALFPVLGKVPDLSFDGMANFLVAGYCYADNSLYENIRYLTPGTALKYNVARGEFTTKRIWNLEFKPSKQLRSKAKALQALYNANLDAHNAVAVSPECSGDILLSGGLDSRGILATLDELGPRPKKAISYGLTKSIPGSDAQTAESLARIYDLPFDFMSYDTGTFVDQAHDWCWISELANDNLGWFAEGPAVFDSYYDSDAPFTLIGDECWGWEGWVDSQEEARQAVFPARVPDSLLHLLDSERNTEFSQSYEMQIAKVEAQCDARDWVDRKDYTYLYGRVCRYIFSMGYYRELGTQLRRPFLAGPLLETIAQLPRKFRINKSLYREMLKRYYPKSMSVPNKSANSLPDWQYDVRKNAEIRAFFLEQLSESRFRDGPLNGLLEWERVAQLRDAWFGADVSKKQRQGKRTSSLSQLVSTVLEKSRLLNRLKRKLVGSSLGRSGSDFDFLRRIALLHLLHQRLAEERVQVKVGYAQ